MIRMKNATCIAAENAATPQEYLHDLLAATAADGTLDLVWIEPHTDGASEDLPVRVRLCWDSARCEELIFELDALLDALWAMRGMIDRLDGDAQTAQALLGDARLYAVWEVYLRHMDERPADDVWGRRLDTAIRRVSRLMQLDAPKIVLTNEEKQLAAALLICRCALSVSPIA